jgi:hypothetical protein
MAGLSLELRVVVLDPCASRISLGGGGRDLHELSDACFSLEVLS